MLVAHWLESEARRRQHLTVNQRVPGSSPGGGAGETATLHQQFKPFIFEGFFLMIKYEKTAYS